VSGSEARAKPVAADSLPEAVFRVEQHIRFPHCDAAGIVYTGRYVDLLNISIEAFYESLGLDYYGLLREGRIGLGYASVGMDFHQPAFMGDRLTFAVLVERVGRSSLHFRVHGHRGETAILQARLVTVTTDLETHASTPLPHKVKSAMAAYQERCR
jgi:YbgC/YbaW family acyl-CoA thioester hydrolase